CQASSEQFQQRTDSLLLCNGRLGPFAVTVLPIALARRAPLLHWVEAGSVASGLLSRKCSALVHVGGFAAEEEVGARRREESNRFGVFAEPSLVLRASRNDHDVPRAADALFAAEAKLHLALEHPHDLFIFVSVRLNMDASPDAPPYEHSLITGENAAAD